MTHTDDTPPSNASPLARAFTDHPATVGETYGEHARFAFGFSWQLLLASGAAFVHAVLPFLCQTTAGRIVTRLHARIEARH